MNSIYQVRENITVAATTNITLQEAKDYLKVTAASEDDLITQMIKTAEEQAQKHTDLCVNATNVALYITDCEQDSKGYYTVDLPYTGTVTNLVVNSVLKGVETTLDSDQYWIKGKDSLSITPQLTSTQDAEFNITYIVAPLNLPEGFKDACLKLVADYYEQRGNESVVPVMALRNNTKAMLNKYRNTRTYI